MSDTQDRQLDGYLAGQLSRPEQRALAQAALDDPELFDELTSVAVVKAAMIRDAGVSGHRSNNRRVAWMFAGVAAAAAAVIAVVMVDRSSTNSTQPPTSDVGAAFRRPGAEAVTQPRDAFQPLILTARLDEVGGRSTPEFRSPAGVSRPPKIEGIVIAVEEGEVAVDLGSLDGLAKGSELRVFRENAKTEPVGRLTIATVFRERARGRATPADSVQVGDRVEVGPTARLSAVVEQTKARVSAGDTEAARVLVDRAVSMSDGAPAATRAALAEAMNEIGAVLIERQDYAEAETILRRAQMHAVEATAVRVANNLAALAALRGDVAAAESMYRSALALAGNSPEHESDRRSIEKNLDGLRSSR